MKRYFIFLGAICLILASCANIEENATETDNTAETDNAAETDNTEIRDQETEPRKYYAADGTELNLNMSWIDSSNLLTADDIYLLSYCCGYISRVDSYRIIIENQEQLDFAMERYALALPPDGLNEDELWEFGSTAIAEPFNEMMENYPIGDYSYVVEYEDVNHGGYAALQIGALYVDHDNLYFVPKVSNVPSGDYGEAFPDVMDGFCYMAAIPKDTLMNERYDSWTYPDRNDLYQDIDFTCWVNYTYSDTTKLYQIYGDTGYIVQSREELQALVNMAQSNGMEFYFNPYVDFDRAVLLVRFFESASASQGRSRATITIEGNNINMEYDTSGSDCTGLAYATIPLRFLPDTLTADWQSPSNE